ncbi:MAG: hypothetical protein HGA19_10815 [Oscillochloris sp.]|nr:hypothetical protein [Oscillochloris sp.]
MIFMRAYGGAVAVSAEPSKVFARYRQLKRTAPEAGGVLLGRLIRASRDIVVDVATEPGLGDKAYRFSFRRAQKRTQLLINQAWQESSGTRNYLGEWHTHPEDDPSPSTVDLLNWRRIASSTIYEQESLLFVVVGRVHMRMWELVRASETLTQLACQANT